MLYAMIGSMESVNYRNGKTVVKLTPSRAGPEQGFLLISSVSKVKLYFFDDTSELALEKKIILHEN